MPAIACQRDRALGATGMTSNWAQHVAPLHEIPTPVRRDGHRECCKRASDWYCAARFRASASARLGGELPGIAPRPGVLRLGRRSGARGSRRGGARRAVRRRPRRGCLGADDVQAVTICSTNDTHAVLAVAAAQAGKDIMVQKPMATTLADCDRIVAAVEAAGVRYYQSHNLRFDPVHQEIERLVVAGEVGPDCYRAATPFTRLRFAATGGAGLDAGPRPGWRWRVHG